MISKNFITEELDIEKDNVWDSFVVQTSQYSIFSSSFWLKMISEMMGIPLKLLVCHKGKELVAGLPLFVYKTLEGNTIKHPILTQFSGVHILKRETRYPYKKEMEGKKIFSSIIDYLEKNYDYVNLINHPALIDIRPFQWRGWHCNVRYTSELNLKKIDDIFKKIDNSVLNKIRKAEKLGIKIEQMNDTEMFYKLWRLSYKRKKIKVPLTKNIFFKWADRLLNKKLIKIYFAILKNNIAIASRLELIDVDIAYDLMAGANPNFFNTGANQLLMTSIFRDLLANGINRFDFVGADIPSIAYYKSSFGGTLIPHYQVSKAISLRAKSIRLLKDFYHFIKPTPLN